MIAKKKVQIFSKLEDFSLQFSLQKHQLNPSLQRTFCLQPSLQLQIGLNTVCKEKAKQYQTLTTNAFSGFVCTNANLAQPMQPNFICKN
jgi:hypothetical protein